jgi:hypothetical protein
MSEARSLATKIRGTVTYAEALGDKRDQMILWLNGEQLLTLYESESPEFLNRDNFADERLVAVPDTLRGQFYGVPVHYKEGVSDGYLEIDGVKQVQIV